MDNTDRPNSGPRRALIIDDDGDVSALLALYLRRLDMHVVQASSGPEGIGLLEEVDPTLVLVDLMLPNLSGYQVCERIRSTPIGTRIPMLAVSGRGLPEDVACAIESGFDDHLKKPFSEAALRAKVERLLIRTTRIE